MSNIVFQPTPEGDALVRFQNWKLQDKIDKHMASMGEAPGPAYVAGEYIDDELTSRQMKDFDAGWDVIVRKPAWNAAHYWGFDANTVFE